MQAGPSIPVCNNCFYADDVTPLGRVDGDWEYQCENPKHGATPHTWIVESGTATAYVPSREGYLEDFNAYADLLSCIHSDDGWLEYGVVEHRFRQVSPHYIQMCHLYTHSAMNAIRGGRLVDPPQTATISARLARALGQLSNEGLVSKNWLPATGFWSYNQPISYWAPVPAPPGSERVTWTAFAEGQNLDGQQWILPDAVYE